MTQQLRAAKDEFGPEIAVIETCLKNCITGDKIMHLLDGLKASGDITSYSYNVVNRTDVFPLQMEYNPTYGKSNFEQWSVYYNGVYIGYVRETYWGDLSGYADTMGHKHVNLNYPKGNGKAPEDIAIELIQHCKKAGRIK
jgi:hypothetical protein